MRKMILALALGGLAACAEDRRGGDDFRSDPKAPYVEVALSRVVAFPAEYRDLDITFTAMFNRANEDIFLAVYTPFTAERYTSFSVWLDDTRVWLPGDSSSRQIRTMYMRKDHPHLQRIFDLRRFQPVIIHGEVKSHFLDRPWIEVYEIRSGGDALYSSNSIADVLSGYDLMERKDYAGAITAFHRAMGLGVSSQAEKDIYVALARCHMKTAKTPEDRARAIGLYEEAAERDPEDIELQRELERARTQPIGAEMERGPDGPKPPPGDSGMNQKVKDLEAKVAQKDAEIAALKEQLAKGGAADPDQLAKLTKERDDAAAALAAAQKACEEHNAKLNEANQSLQTANADKAAAVADRDAKMKDLEAAQKSVAELQAKVDEFTRAGGADMQKIQKQLDDATAAKAAAETRVAELEAKVKDLEAKAAAGGAGDPEAMKKLQDELAAAKADVAKAKENEETIKKTVRDEVEKEQSEIIDKLRDTIKSQRQEIEELQKRLKEKQ